MRLLPAILCLCSLATAQRTSYEYGWECGTKLALKGEATCGLYAGLTAHIHSEANRPGVLVLGSMTSTWWRLPLSLSGAGCYVFLDPLAFMPFATDYKGQHAFAFGFQDCSLAGIWVHQQVFVLMKDAPYWGTTLSASQAWAFQIVRR